MFFKENHANMCVFQRKPCEYLCFSKKTGEYLCFSKNTIRIFVFFKENHTTICSNKTSEYVCFSNYTGVDPNHKVRVLRSVKVLVSTEQRGGGEEEDHANMCVFQRKPCEY